MNNRNLDKTFARTLVVWWAFTWRVSIISLFGAVFAGFVSGLVATGLGFETRTVVTWIQSSFFIVGIPVGMLVMRIVLLKNYSSFRIEFVSNKPSIQEQHVNVKT